MASNQLTTPFKHIISYGMLKCLTQTHVGKTFHVIYSQLMFRSICVLSTLLMLFATIHRNGPWSYRVTALMVRDCPLLLSVILSHAVTGELLFCHEIHIGVPFPEQVNVTLSLNSTRFVLLTLEDTALTGSASKQKDYT